MTLQCNNSERGTPLKEEEMVGVTDLGLADEVSPAAFNLPRGVISALAETGGSI